MVKKKTKLFTFFLNPYSSIAPLLGCYKCHTFVISFKEEHLLENIQMKNIQQNPSITSAPSIFFEFISISKVLLIRHDLPWKKTFCEVALLLITLGVMAQRSQLCGR